MSERTAAIDWDKMEETLKRLTEAAKEDPKLGKKLFKIEWDRVRLEAKQEALREVGEKLKVMEHLYLVAKKLDSYNKGFYEALVEVRESLIEGEK